MTRYLVIDTETTGLNPIKGGHRVIELACIEYLYDKPTGTVFNLKLNPEGKKSSGGAFRVHRIADDELVDKPRFKDVLDRFLSLVSGAHIVAFNSDFDVSFLNAELLRAGHSSTMQDISGQISCAMKIARSKFNVTKISLDAACRRYGIDTKRRVVHTAHIDAELCAELFFKLIDKNQTPLSKTPQQTPHRKTKAISIPRAYVDKETGVKTQVNFCKNPACQNYGVPAKNPTYKSNGQLNRGLGNEYRLSHKSGQLDDYLSCKLCGQTTVMINNRCLVGEIARYQDIGKQQEPSCALKNDPNQPYGTRYYYIPESAENRRGERRPHGFCVNSTKGIFSHPDCYILAGKSRPDKVVEYLTKEASTTGGKPIEKLRNEVRKGSQRFDCNGCFTKFSVKLDPQQRHYRRDLNIPLFLDMMNKGIINRAQEKFKVSARVIYDKLNFYYKQALAFDAYHSERLSEKIENGMLSLSTDRQHYLSNWGDHNAPMPTPILNTSTADNGSGFIFASTVNFDFTTDYRYVTKEYREKKEYEKQSYYSRFAQYVLNDDEANKQVSGLNAGVPMQTPAKGLLVQQTYNILTHFYLIKEMLGKANSINLFADNDSGFKLAICGVFQDWIASGKMNAFQVTVDRAGGHNLLDKSTTERLEMRLSELKSDYPDLDENERLRLLWKEEISTRVIKPGSKSEWIVSPNLKSRFSGVLPLIDLDNADMDELVDRLEQASLHGVDNWFQIIRRHVNMLERPVTSGTNSRRWNAYAGYNPEWMVKLIEIKRVYFNYCLTDERILRSKGSKAKPSTPAMRLGLTDRVFDANDFLSFSYNEKMINRHYRL